MKLKNLLLFGLIFLFIASCGKKEENVIKIGHIAPLTGDAAQWGKWEVEGITLAVGEINQNGGIFGRRLEIIHEDDKASPQVAVSIIQKFININKMRAVIGATLSSTTLACAPIAEKNKVVLLSPSAQSPKISEAGDFIFRLFVSSTVEGKYLADLADHYNIRTVGILYINNDYGLGLKNEIATQLSGKNTLITATERYDAETKNFRAQINNIKRANVDAIYLLGYPLDMATALIQIKELGVKSIIFAPDSFEAEEIITIAKSAAEGVIYVYPILLDVDYGKNIRQKFYDKYNIEMNIYNAMGYDAVKILAYSIEQVLAEDKIFNGELIKEQLYRIKDFKGITGLITFDGNGDVKDRPMEIRVVKNGKFIILTNSS